MAGHELGSSTGLRVWGSPLTIGGASQCPSLWTYHIPNWTYSQLCISYMAVGFPREKENDVKLHKG